VVVSKDGTQILGAYPMTTEPTPHRLVLPGRTIHAMCAVDALSVGAMYGGEVEIESKCRVTHAPVRVKMDGARIVSASPGSVLVGVRWDKASGVPAAHSLCMEMVFLRDEAAVAKWSGGDFESHTVLSLEEGAEFGARFFKPLVESAYSRAAQDVSPLQDPARIGRVGAAQGEAGKTACSPRS
jgi:mercuric reductase